MIAKLPEQGLQRKTQPSAKRKKDKLCTDNKIKVFAIFMIWPKMCQDYMMFEDLSVCKDILSEYSKV